MKALRAGPIAFAWTSAGIAVALVLGLSTPLYPAASGVFVLAILVVGLLWRIPADSLPSVALGVYALWPVNYLPHRVVFLLAPPPILVLLAWALRRRQTMARIKPLPVVGFLSAAITLWLAIRTLDSISFATSASWSLLSMASIIWVASLGRRMSTRSLLLLERTIIGLTGLLGGFALLEYILKFNPIFGSRLINGSDDTPLVQAWSVYRVTTTLGHPLANGTFFAFGVTICLAAVIAKRSRAAGLAATIGLSALVTSGARGSMLAAGAGCLYVIVAGSLRLWQAPRAIALGSVSVLLSWITFNTHAVQRRLGSGEAVGSAQERLHAFEITKQLVSASHYIGYGPGTARIVNQTQSILESSYYQLAVSLGLPGLGLVLGLLVTTVIGLMRRGAQAAAGALITLGLSAGTYNLAESNRPALILFGFAAMLGLAGGSVPEAAPETRAPIPASADDHRPSSLGAR